MKREDRIFAGIFFLGAILYFFSSASLALASSLIQVSGGYFGPQISSATYGSVLASSTTATAIPTRRMLCRRQLIFTNSSSSQAVSMAPAFTLPTDVIANGSLLSVSTGTIPRIILDLDPLGPKVTWYFQSPAGFSATIVNYIELGCPGGFE